MKTMQDVSKGMNDKWRSVSLVIPHVQIVSVPDIENISSPCADCKALLRNSAGAAILILENTVTSIDNRERPSKSNLAINLPQTIRNEITTTLYTVCAATSKSQKFEGFDHGDDEHRLLMPINRGKCFSKPLMNYKPSTNA